MLGRVYLLKHVFQHGHLLPESFNGDLQCINVCEQILQGSYGLKMGRGKENVKLSVVSGKDKLNVEALWWWSWF